MLRNYLCTLDASGPSFVVIKMREKKGRKHPDKTGLLTPQPHGLSTPSFSVLHCLPEFAQTHVH